MTAKDGAAQIATDLLGQLDAAWNAADGTAFAAAFTEDVKVVNIFGMHIRGRAATAQRMQHIFDTIFAGSRHLGRQLDQARFLTDGVVLAISAATVAVPSGPFAPEMRNRQTAVLVQADGAWRIAAWQNTLLGTSPPA
jgi:uncharacterized protein (TIGR02246 family)